MYYYSLLFLTFKFDAYIVTPFSLPLIQKYNPSSDIATCGIMRVDEVTSVALSDIRE